MDELRTCTDRSVCNKHSTYKKLAVQWLNETLCFVSSLVLAESLVLRNPLLRQAPKRYAQPYDNIGTSNSVQETNI